VTLIALCVTLLWVSAGYADGTSDNPDAQRSGKGCPDLYQQSSPVTGRTTSYGEGFDGDIQAEAPLRHRDNGDKAITDTNTKLMWEKKHLSGDVPDVNNTYTRRSSISDTVAHGTMFTDFLKTLNTRPCFAQSCDWRIPMIKEIQSIVDYGVVTSLNVPGVDTAFNNHRTSGCTVDGANKTQKCSCTLSEAQ
jgi:hypothetical protein